MILVSGSAKFRIGYNLKIDMTEEKWDSLSERQQNEIIDDLIGYDEMQNVEMDDCDVDDVITI